MKVCSPLFAVAIAAVAFAPRVSATCAPICSSSDPACVSQAVPVNAPLQITTPGDSTCPYGKYLTSLVLAPASTDTIAVAFSDSLSATPTTTTDTDGVTLCSQSYSNVGKGVSGLTSSVSATVTCQNANNADCTLTYQAVYTCQSDPAVCAQTCSSASCTASTIAASSELDLTAPSACPDSFSYLKSLTVGARDKTAIAVTLTGASASPSASADTCFIQYGKIGDPTTLDVDVTATVTCGDTSQPCNVQTYPEWGCDAPVCAKTCSSCTEKVLAAGTNVTVAKPSGFTCDAGSFAYPKGVTVAGKYAAYNVSVAFNNGLTPTASDSSASCYVKYSDPVGTSANVTSDVDVTIACADSTAPCTAEYSIDSWSCYAPPDATQTYTRTATTGTNCPTLSDCANRCAKSYRIGKKDNGLTFVSQLTPDGCTCADLTAVGTEAAGAANADTTMGVTFDATLDTMTIEYTESAIACESTYANVTFTNDFVTKTYTRQSVAPADCAQAADCGYQCAAELAITTPETDTVLATPADVANCTCTPITAVIGDDGTAAGGNTTVAYLFAETAAGIAVNTTVAAKTCYATYTEKVATLPPQPTTTTTAPPTTAPAPTTATTGTGTSAGVSAAGAGVCTVTLAAAAAGVQAVILPH